MIFFGPKKCRKHEYNVVAFDSSFYTQYTDTEQKRQHHLRWLRCKHCGQRHMETDGATRHRGVEQAKNRWVEQNIVWLTAEGEVYDPDYECVTPPTASTMGTFKFKPITGTQRLLNQLRDDPEFRKLCHHQMVADAFGELETVVKMHENIDK